MKQALPSLSTYVAHPSVCPGVERTASRCLPILICTDTLCSIRLKALQNGNSKSRPYPREGRRAGAHFEKIYRFTMPNKHVSFGVGPFGNDGLHSR